MCVCVCARARVTNLDHLQVGVSEVEQEADQNIVDLVLEDGFS